jgi:hypothetical protein
VVEIFFRRRLTSTRRSGSLGLLVQVVFICFVISASAPSHYTVVSDRVGSLSDRHLAQPGLCPIVLGLCPIIIWFSLVSVRSSSGLAWSLSDRHLAQPGLYPIVIWLSLVFVRLCRVSIRSSFCSASFFVWCVAGPIHSVIYYSGRVLSLISNVVFLAPFQVSGAVPSTVPRADS